MNHKIEIWVDKYNRELSFMAESKDNPGEYTIVDIPSFYVEDEIQTDKFIELFKYLGYDDVVVKEIESED